MKLSNGQLLAVAGGLGLLAWYVARQSAAGLPLFGGLGTFSTLMPSSPTRAQLAAHYAANAGRGPSQAGTNGAGATSSQPVYAGSLAGLGSFVGSLFQRIAGPGNAAPAGRPQSSASSGGGVSQPTPGSSLGYTEIFDQSQTFFGEYDNTFGDFPEMGAGAGGYAFEGSQYIVSDQGTYDAATGEWYD